ncbi:DUF7415 domain-containing protein [Shewanella surugensis]|uniref:DUF7415 domain-containing protein n=1 Tax=Shewanella surugensis TaxID=212020 RepID=A0ABT0LIJ1_9GAMM|nr:hypothetical protein [Shewanella surugensis]MCL1127519.1 hypothetical protein [Shewanella surugensis]
MSELKKVDWNQASDLGLIERINTEILHPLGLAMTRNPETGISTYLLVADVQHFEYAAEIESKLKPILSKDEIHRK